MSKDGPGVQGWGVLLSGVLDPRVGKARTQGKHHLGNGLESVIVMTVGSGRICNKDARYSLFLLVY